MTPSSFLFTLTLMAGTIISVSSTNWLYLWIGMELNLLSLVPLIASSSNLQETEASVKYFMIQAIGSGLMLMTGIMSMNPYNTSTAPNLISMLFITSMIIKLGMAPCHQWLPHVMSCIPWSMCIILTTWQKISPLIMLMWITPKHTILFTSIIITASAIVGGIGGLNQAQMRTLLAYSSIGHMAWMLSTLNYSFSLFATYFITYVIISITLMSIFIMNNVLLNKTFSSLLSNNSTSFIIMMVILFSLGGLPPLLGFLPKWMIISTLMSDNMSALLFALILGSLMNLFYYFNVTFNFVLLKNYTFHTQTIPIKLMLMTSIATMTSFLMIL